MGDVMKTSGMKTLVLGGSTEVSREIENILNLQGFSAQMAPSLESCMQSIETDDYGLMIVDFNMCSGNEMNLLRNIQDKNKDIAVLGLGNLHVHDPALYAVRQMMAGYLEKPVDKNVLLQTVENIESKKNVSDAMRKTLLVAIGKRIRTERKKQSFTLKQVASKARLSVSLLSQIERAESAASVSSLYKIASALNTSIRSFFEGY
jgi:DNA-binding NtrC family response regulator